MKKKKKKSKIIKRILFFIIILLIIYAGIFGYKTHVNGGGMQGLLATLVGKYQGVDTPIFAVSLILAAVVMYDACGIRRAAGKQAALLNKIIATPGLTGLQVSEKLVEVLGHTPFQVLVGALIGVIAGLIM